MPILIARATANEILLERVGELHQRGDGGVEMEPVVVLSDLPDGLVQAPVQDRRRCIGPRHGK